MGDCTIIKNKAEFETTAKKFPGTKLNGCWVAFFEAKIESEQKLVISPPKTILPSILAAPATVPAPSNRQPFLPIQFDTVHIIFKTKCYHSNLNLIAKKGNFRLSLNLSNFNVSISGLLKSLNVSTFERSLN